MIEQIKLQRDGTGAILTLDHGRANAIGPQMVAEFLGALNELENDKALRTLILTGRPGMFSAGLNVPELVALNRAEMTSFWEVFNELCYRLYTSDLMIVSAIGGHSPAGGCVLAIMTDYRIMASGAFKIGLNEVGVGIPIPGGITEVYASVVGLRRAQDLGCRGAMVNPQSALQIGLVDEVVPADRLMEAAQAKAAQWARCSRVAQITTKHLFRRTIAERLEASADVDQDAFLDLWFSDESQAILHELVQRLTG